MTQNTSTAVMARRTEPLDSFDDFPTPPWAGRALVEHVLRPMGVVPEECSCWEPAANRGFLVKALEESFSSVLASDIHDYGAGYPTHDFLKGATWGLSDHCWIITNPPFRLAEDFTYAGLEIATKGVAMLARTSFLEGKSRYKNLFAVNPPTVVATFVERLSLYKGRVADGGNSATSYSWFVWDSKDTEPGYKGRWIPPCRKELEREGDYDQTCQILIRKKSKDGTGGQKWINVPGDYTSVGLFQISPFEIFEQDVPAGYTMVDYRKVRT